MSLGGTNILGLILEVTDNATPVLRSFGSSLAMAGRQVDSFGTVFGNMERNANQSVGKVKGTMEELRNIMNKPLPDPVENWSPLDRMNPALNQAEARYNSFMDNLHRTSQRYQSAIMGSVALSMTGIGIQNYSRPILQEWTKMIQSAMAYQQALVKIQLTTANFGGLKGASLNQANQQISNSVQAAGIASPLSNAQMADMTQTLATMGYHKAGQLNSLIAPSMLLQAISQKSDGSFELDQNQAAQLLSSVVLQSGRGLGKMTNQTMAGQSFKGVSSNAMGIVSQMTKAAHDAHLTYADIQSYVNSAGASMSMSHMSLADFLTMGGAMKKMGLNARRGGMDVQGLVQAAAKFDASNAEKAPKQGSDGWWAQKLGFTLSNLSKGGNFMDNLLKVVDSANKNGDGQILMKLANSTGRNVISSLMQLQTQYGKHVSGVDMNAQMISKDIGSAGNGDYAKKRLDALSQTPQYQWQQFLGTIESIGQNIGMTVLPTLNKFLGYVNDLSGKFLNFTQQHPKIAEMLGMGMGLTGLLGMATGKMLTFVGEITAATFSLMNYRLQLIMSRADQSMFNDGMVTGNQVLGEGGFLGTLKKIGLQLGIAGLALGGLYAAWKLDLGGIQELVKGFASNVQTAWKNISSGISDFQSNNAKAFNKQVADINKQGQNWVKFSHFLLDVAMVFSAFVTSFNSNKLSVAQFDMLKKEGLLPFLDKLLNAKYEVQTFFEGFAKGFKTFTQTLSTALAPLKPLWNWFLDSIGLRSSGSGNGRDLTGSKGAKNLTGIGDAIGKVVGVLAGAVISIRIYSKLINLALGGIGKGVNLGKGIFKFGKGLFNMVRHPIQTLKGGGDFLRRDITKAVEDNKGVLYRVLGADSFQIYKKLRQYIALAIRDGVEEGNGGNPPHPPGPGGSGGSGGGSGGSGGSSRWQRLKNGVRSRFTRAGRSDRRWEQITNGMSEQDAHEVRRLFNSGNVHDRAEATRMLDAHRGINRSTISEHELNSAGYHAFRDANGRDLSYTRRTRNQRILEAARNLHAQGRLDMSQQELEAMFQSHRGSADHHISRLRTRDYINDGAELTEMGLAREARTASRAARTSRFLSGTRTGRMLGFMGRAGKGIGRFALGTGGKVLGGVGAALGVLTMFPDIAEAASKNGAGGAVDAIGSSMGISKKGGAGSAMQGALAGAGIGMMFGPVGAAVGAAIGGIAGAIGTAKIKKFGTDLMHTAQSAWKNIQSAGKNVWGAITGAGNATWNAMKTAGNATWNATKATGNAVWGAMKAVGQAYWTFVTSYAKSEWNLITGIATAVWNGVKGVAQGVWNFITDFARGRWGNLGADLNKIWDSFKGAAQAAWNSILGFIKNNPITQGIQKAGSSIINGVKSFFGINGSHAGGLTRVPFDGYVAELHKDEMVLTAKQAEDYRKNSQSISQAFRDHAKATASISSNNGGDTHISFDKGAIVVQMANASSAEVEKAADQLFRKFMKKVEDKNIRNYAPSRMRGQLT